MTLKWWLMFCTSATLLAASWPLGLLQLMWSIDRTYLTSATLILYFAVSLFIGWAIRQYKGTEGDDSVGPYLKVCWFITEFLFGIGIAGNSAGILMMAQVYRTAEQGQRGAAALGGLENAALVTLVAVTCSYALKWQLVLVELNLDLTANGRRWQRQ